MKTNSSIEMAAVSLLAVMLFATGCREPKKVTVPIVAIVESSVEVGQNTALLYAEVVDDGDAVVTERGFCYGKVGDAMDTLVCNENTETFSITLTDLAPITAYVCQAFARNEAGRGFSSEFRFTTESDTVPKVKTFEARDITCCSAVVNGQVLSSGSQEVVERGICYSIEPQPSVGNSCVVGGSGVGPFECQLTGLSAETRYYYRAYAVCTHGVYYGYERSFFTEVLPLEVLTGGVSDVTATRVKAEGKVTRDGGYEVTECGFCWGTEHEPTIEGFHIKVSVGLGKFSGYFSGLERGRTHYVRAYAVNDEGIAYGHEVEFVPDDHFSSWSQGTLPGMFSISEDRKIRFSQGNLQYCKDGNQWRFAEKQWDFVGGPLRIVTIGEMNIGTVYANGAKCDNTMVSQSYDGWIDLFGWGTSGWNNGNTYYRPYDYVCHVSELGFTNDGSYYGPAGHIDLTGDYAHADWGVHNTIGNGGSRQWRTLSAEEFSYLVLERVTPSGILCAKAVVTGIPGLILLPDDWNASTYYLSNASTNGYYTSNIITGEDWLGVLEPAGAVFLPAAGLRHQWVGSDERVYINESAVPYISCYWTTTQAQLETACVLNFSDGWPVDDLAIIGMERCYGCPARLITDE